MSYQVVARDDKAIANIFLNSIFLEKDSYRWYVYF